MGMQIILLWVGLSITFTLGLINFLWGPAILARREKVLIVNPEVSAEFWVKGALHRSHEYTIALSEHNVLIETRCELLLKSMGMKLDVKEVKVILDEEACKSIKRYFQTPLKNRVYLSYINLGEETPVSRTANATLEPKQPLNFQSETFLQCTDKFNQEYEETGSDAYPEFIQPLLNKLETNYQICWTRYDGKEVCWRFPNKWWRNLGKKIWG